MRKILLLLLTVLTVQSVKINTAFSEIQKDLKDQNDQRLIQFKESKGAQMMLQISSQMKSVWTTNHKGWALDLGGKLFEAFKNTNKTNLNQTEFMHVMKEWYQTHGMEFGGEQYNSSKNIFNFIDSDHSGNVTKGEVFHALFKMMDHNGDGVWNKTEVHDFITQYANILKRNMSSGWQDVLNKALEEINYGVSAHELMLSLSRKGQDIRTFKDFIIDNSKPLPKEQLDTFEILETIMNAIVNSSEARVNKQNFTDIVMKYIVSKHHQWNDTMQENVHEYFDKIDTNNDSYVDRKELFHFVFNHMDKNGDHQLDKNEIKELFLNYAKAMNREMNDGWWKDHVEPAIKEMESGVSPDELWHYLEKNNKKITDFRHLVFSISDPENDSNDDDNKDDEKKDEEEHNDDDEKKDEEHHDDEKKDEEEHNDDDTTPNE